MNAAADSSHRHNRKRHRGSVSNSPPLHCFCNTNESVRARREFCRVHRLSLTECIHCWQLVSDADIPEPPLFTATHSWEGSALPLTLSVSRACFCCHSVCLPPLSDRLTDRPLVRSRERGTFPPHIQFASEFFTNRTKRLRIWISNLFRSKQSHIYIYGHVLNWYRQHF